MMVRGPNGAETRTIPSIPERPLVNGKSVNLRPFKPSDKGSVVALWEACDLVRPWNDPFKDIQFCRDSGHGEILAKAKKLAGKYWKKYVLK